MVNIVVGRTGRLWDVILKQVKASLDENKPCVLIVPELYTLQAERDLIRDLNLPGLLKVQVFSPSRLKYKVFERAGSDQSVSLEEQGQRIAFARAIENCRKKLVFYKKAADKPGFIDAVTKWLMQIKERDISPQDLSTAAENTPKNSLSKKLKDLSLIYKTYEDFISHQGFYDALDSDLDMIRRLKSSGIMQNASCLVYGFDSISQKLNGILVSIAKEADKLLVTLVADKAQAEDGDAFSASLKSAQQLMFDMQKNNIETEFSFYDAPLKAEPDIQHLEKYFLSLRRKTYPKMPASIRLYLGQTPYKEAEFVAYMVKKQLLDGIDPQDILLVCGNLSRYSAILYNLLTAFDVPFYISEKTPFTSHNAVKAVLLSFDIITDGFRTEDVKAYITTGYSMLSKHEGWQIINYAEAYGINGNMWLKAFERGDEQQRVINEDIRKKLITPLVKLKENLSSAENAYASIEAELMFLHETGVFEKLEEHEQLMLDAKLYTAADTDKQIWQKLLDNFDQMQLLLGEEKLSIKSFVFLLRSSFESFSLSSLPPKIGCVQVGELGKILPSSPKVTFVMGLNDGVLSDLETSIISDMDLTLTENALGAEAGTILGDYEQQNLISLYNALSSPSQKLFVSYALSQETGEALEPLTQITSIKKLFPYLVEEGGVLASVEEMYPPIAAMPALKAMPNKLRDGKLDDNWLEALNFLRTDEEYKDRAEQLFALLKGKQTVQKISKGRAERLYNLSNMSVSRLQNFAACPFRHFVQSGLRPAEKKEWKIESKDRGNFYHAALEAFSKKAHEYEKYPNISRAESDYIMEQAGTDIINSIKDLPLADSFRSKAKTRSFIRDCKKTAWTLTRGLQNSSFVILKVELEFGNVGGVSPVMIKLADGRTLYLTGKIDRLDGYKSDLENYVRIIDYKSGDTRLSPEDIFAGLQLQLLIYLKAVSDESDAVPAGVFYQRVRTPLIDETEKYIEPEILQRDIDSTFTMTGISLKEQEVFLLMDAGEPPLSLGKLFNKDGSPAKGKMLASREEMQLLMDFALDKARELAMQIKSGKISASPYVNKYGNGPCDYCEYSGICRRDPVLSAKNMRIKEPMSFEELIEKIRQEKA
ncbi:MAG: PD-(D/E)XK nuclease family protein [Eubacteriales bacterium]|nr:PD-(D/E)XK nuclease family protein [Eubacteriales bacterium]